jgi:hypothetical protein
LYQFSVCSSKKVFGSVATAELVQRNGQVTMGLLYFFREENSLKHKLMEEQGYQYATMHKQRR